jgi:probable HAF family extracellular repeat protein
LSKGAFTSIDVPGALAGGTSAPGINFEGDIVGSFADSSGNPHGFLLSKGRFTTIDVPAAFGIGTQAYGINPQSDIVGLILTAAA